MYPAPSERFVAALAQSYRLATVVEAHWPDGTVTEIPHTGGSVTVDRGQAVRRTCTITTADRSLLPASPGAFLAVSGLRLVVRYGIAYADGAVETVPLGTFRLDTLDGDPDVGPVTITGSSLEAVVADDSFENPRTTRAATGAVQAITSLVQQSLPGAIVMADVPDTALGVRTWDRGADRLAAVQEIATAVGAEVYTDPDGIWRVAELPEVLTAPVAWEIAAGEGGALISASSGWSREGMYNVVVASGEGVESGQPPVSATVRDDDPTSPTYYLGPFGRVPRFYSSPTLTTTSQCTIAATRLLRDSVKPAVEADVTSLPNPLLEPGDVVRVVYASGRRDLHQIQALTIGLSPGDASTLTMIGGREDA